VSNNPKVFEFAKEIGWTPLALMDKIREWQLPVKSHMAELEPEVLAQLKVRLSGGASGGASDAPVKTKKAPTRKVAAPKKAIAKEAEAASPVAATVASASAAAAGKTVVRRKSKDVEEVAPRAKIISRPEEAPAAEMVEEETPVKIKVASVVEEEKTENQEIEPSITPIDKGSLEIIKPELKSMAAKKKINETDAVSSKSTMESTSAIKVGNLASAAPISGQASIVEKVTMAEKATSTEVAHADEVKIPSRKKEVMVGTSGVASSSVPAAGVGRKNIIGRMDLSRVTSPHTGGRPQGGQGGRPGGSYQGSGGIDRGSGSPGGSGPRPGGFGSQNRGPVGGRNLRTGFVAQVIPPPDILGLEESEEHRRAKDNDKKAKKFGMGTGPAVSNRTEKETEEEQVFNAVEFRKREMVFQPKKKKGMLSREALSTQITTPKASKRVVKINGTMKLSILADSMGLKVAQLTKVLMSNGVMATPNTDLDFDTIALIVPEFGFEAQNTFKTADEVAIDTAFGNLDAESIIRPPVVTVMGHVDHGKTSLLDAIRKTDVAAGEAGGITQHIGAYSVKLEDGSLITFLDTPGHEAFTAMRARGANVTDIAVIVVAADDGMMPQTAEAINHAKTAGVPIIVAVNKIDKPGANPERIKQQLTELEIVPEEWGGTTIFCEVSALKRTGIKELLEQIKLTAEVQELKANPERSGTGVVIEAKLEKGKGNVATLLIKDGTVKIGQYIVAGSVKGRIRSLMNDRGERVTDAGPGIPVEVLGLEETPGAGDRFDIVKDDVVASDLVTLRKSQLAKSTEKPKLSLEEIFSKVQKGDVKELALVLKSDVHGSMEAIQGMLNKLNTAEVKIKVIHSAVGGINESDVLLAHTAKGIVLGFNVRPDGGAQAQGKRLGVDIRTYSIVYELIDEMKKAMQGLLTPDIVEKVLGRIEVRNTFSVPKIGTIAGCFVLEGKVQRTNNIRLIRDGKIIYEGKISSLKRFKDDAKEVATGFECGIGIENFNDIKVGDIMEPFIKEEVARELIHNNHAEA